MIASAARSSTDGEREQVRSASGPAARLPTSARAIPSANAVSVDMAVPQPYADARPALKAEKMAIGNDHPAEASASTGTAQAAALAQLAQVELAACLQPDHEEEEGHQAAVHLQPCRSRDMPSAAEADGQPGATTALSNRRVPPAHTSRRSSRRAAPRRCQSGSAGTGAAKPGGSASRRCGSAR